MRKENCCERLLKILYKRLMQFFLDFRIPGERRNVQSAETSAETNQGPEAGSAKPQKDRPVAGIDSKGDRQGDLP